MIAYEFDCYESNPHFSDATTEVSNLTMLVEYCRRHNIVMRLVDVVNGNLVAQFESEYIQVLNNMCKCFGVASWTEIITDSNNVVVKRTLDA